MYSDMTRVTEQLLVLNYLKKCKRATEQLYH